MEKKHRIILLDFMRIACAIMIFLRHSISMFGCSYGYTLDGFIYKMTSPVMTCFFIMSGFSIHYQHRTEEVTSEWTRGFLKKRLISIMPSYLLVVMLWPLFYPDQIKNWIKLMPVELLGLQTIYHTLFGILHNGGTWFVSCLLIAYVVYPVIKSILESGSRKCTIVLALVTNFMLMYSLLVVSSYQLESLYSNAIARTLEFVLGVAYAEAVFGQGSDKKPAYFIFFSFVISVVGALISHGSVEVVNFIVIPSVLLLMYAASVVRSVSLEHSKGLSILSGMSYQFFLTQLFLWKISACILKLIHLEENNFARITVSFVLCVIVSFFVWRFYDKPVKKRLKKIWKLC